MKNIFILAFLLITYSCSKEKEKVPDYIQYDLEIFSGIDSLIYGQWSFLYSQGLWRSWSLPDMNLSPVGKYEYLTKDHVIFQEGKIDTVYGRNGVIRIIFCPDGIKRSPKAELSSAFRFNGHDTLVMSLPGDDVWGYYYLRIK